MTLRERIDAAAFWHEHICLDCGETADQPETLNCDECGGELVAAESLKGLLDRLEQESADDASLG